MSEEPSVKSICDAIGRKKLADALAVGMSAISNACSENVFPARYYAVVKAECDVAGVACPLSLFSFVMPSDVEAAG